MRSWNALLVLVVAVAPASAQRAEDPTEVAPRQTCTAITQANADATAGTVNSANARSDTASTTLTASPPAVGMRQSGLVPTSVRVQYNVVPSTDSNATKPPLRVTCVGSPPDTGAFQISNLPGRSDEK